MREAHAVMLPLPAQGHINAMMNLSFVLASSGVCITVVQLRRAHDKMFKSPEQAREVSENLRQNHGLLIEFIAADNPQGLSGESTTGPVSRRYGQFFKAMQSNDMVLMLHRTLLQISLQNPITCIISDSFMSASYQVASALKLPRVVFWPYCAVSAVSQLHTELLMEQGFIPVKAEELKNPRQQITSLPGIPPIWPKDIRSFFREEFVSDQTFETQVYESKIQSKADWALINTFEELEGIESIQGLSKGYSVQAIGPVFLENFLKQENLGVSPQNLISTSLWEEDNECMKWLDKQSAKSVVYISFGSLVPMCEQQLTELALALKNSGHPFLWVIRPDVAGASAIFSDEYATEVKERGLLVKWAPQLKVLSHPSVGAFLTHNGWNSTIESIGLGVPMIGWPYWSDQFVNCRFSQDVWKIGLDLEARADENGFVNASEIEKALRSVLQGSLGLELRKNASKLKEAAIKAVMPGGSSHTNIEKFVKHINQIANTS